MRVRLVTVLAGLVAVAGLAGAGLIAVAASGSAAASGAAASAGASGRYSSCPSSDRKVPGTEVSARTSELVPPGADGVLLCRYRGLNPSSKRFRLITSDKIKKSSTVLHISKQLNALPPMVGVYSCPADFDSLIVAFFHYRGAPDQVVTLDTGGCEAVANGQLRRTAARASGLVHELESLTR